MFSVLKETSQIRRPLQSVEFVRWLPPVSFFQFGNLPVNPISKHPSKNPLTSPERRACGILRLGLFYYQPTIIQANSQPSQQPTIINHPKTRPACSVQSADIHLNNFIHDNIPGKQPPHRTSSSSSSSPSSASSSAAGRAMVGPWLVNG